MQIYCPKCKTGYEIDADVVPENGRKLRCAVCGKVFKCLPEDLIDGSKLRMAEFTAEEKEHLDEQGRLLEKETEETIVVNASETAALENAAEKDKPEQMQNEEIKEKPEEIVPDTGIAEQAPTKSLEELEEESRDPGSKDVKDIFERLSQETEALFKAESEEKAVKKYLFNLKKTFGLQNPRNYKYYFIVILTLILLSLYYARFEVVRSAPFMESAYRVFGIKAVVTGEGLEFQNVSRRDYEEDYVRKFEVKGFIANQTAKTLQIPTIKIELLDKDARSIQTETVNSVIPLVTSHGKVPFSFIIDKPSPLTKYIYLTFIESI